MSKTFCLENDSTLLGIFEVEQARAKPPDESLRWTGTPILSGMQRFHACMHGGRKFDGQSSQTYVESGFLMRNIIGMKAPDDVSEAVSEILLRILTASCVGFMRFGFITSLVGFIQCMIGSSLIVVWEAESRGLHISERSGESNEFVDYCGRWRKLSVTWKTSLKKRLGQTLVQLEIHHRCYCNSSCSCNLSVCRSSLPNRSHKHNPDCNAVINGGTRIIFPLHGSECRKLHD